MNNKSVLIGSGAYGYVFHPMLTCIKKKSEIITPYYRKNKVSKLFLDKSSSMDEYSQKRILNEINKDNQFLIKPIDICQVAESNKDHIEKAIGQEINMKDARHILYRYGGSEFLKTLKAGDMITTEEFYNLIYTFLIDLSNFQKSGYVHYDIKNDNVMFDKKLYLIDFGLMRNRFMEDFENTFYYVWSPEVVYLNITKDFKFDFLSYVLTNYETLIGRREYRKLYDKYVTFGSGSSGYAKFLESINDYVYLYDFGIGQQFEVENDDLDIIQMININPSYKSYFKGLPNLSTDILTPKQDSWSVGMLLINYFYVMYQKGRIPDPIYAHVIKMINRRILNINAIKRSTIEQFAREFESYFRDTLGIDLHYIPSENVLSPATLSNNSQNTFFTPHLSNKKVNKNVVVINNNNNNNNKNEEVIYVNNNNKTNTIKKNNVIYITNTPNKKNNKKNNKNNFIRINSYNSNNNNSRKNDNNNDNDNDNDNDLQFEMNF